MKKTSAQKRTERLLYSTEPHKISATLGIDLEKATPELVAKRAKEFAEEMADLYNPGTLERGAFDALAAAIEKMIGGN